MQMSSKHNDRFYEVKFGEAKVAIYPGENSLEFELLHARVAEEWTPDGPVEEDAVLTVAKCIWAKQRHQRFLVARRAAASFDPDHEAYDEEAALSGFYHMLLKETDEEELKRWLDRLGGHLADDLRNKCPRRKFDTAEAWIEAMRLETCKLYVRATLFGRPPDEVLMGQSAAFLTDEVFARELDLEERIDAQLKQALDRLLALKKAKRLVSFRAIQRFERTHPERLGKTIIVRQTSR
jgi:hypothetical protein